MIGTVLQEGEAAHCFVLGITYDSDTNHQFIDHVLVGRQRKVDQAKGNRIPFFSTLRYASVDLEGFAYRVALVARQARGGALEPFYGSRDTAHNTKCGTRVLTASSTCLHLGDIHVCTGHALDLDLPVRAFYGNRKQSDAESAERISSKNFSCNGGSEIHWTSHGHLVFAFVLRMAGRPTWAPLLWRQPSVRLIHNLVPYHFFEVCRWDNATRRDRSPSTFINPITYLGIHRHSVHNILKDCSWPQSWPPYVGARQTEYFAEGQFAAKRRLGPPHGQGCSNWIRSTTINHRAQANDFSREGKPGEIFKCEVDTLSKEDKTRHNNIAQQIAVRLFVLCCPETYSDQTVGAAVSELLAKYKKWSASTTNLPPEKADDDDSDAENGPEEDDEDRARTASRLGCFGAASRLGACLHW